MRITRILAGLAVLVLPVVPAAPVAASSAAEASCHGMPALLVTTQAQADRAGTPGDDVIVVAKADLQVDAGAGDDSVCADPRADYDKWSGVYVDGGPGNDWLRGAHGSDLIHGDAGDDYVHGGAGGDNLDGDGWASRADGNDRILGGAGADLIRGRIGSGTYEEGVDRIDGGPGDDLLDHQEMNAALQIDLRAGVVTRRLGGQLDHFTAVERVWDTRHADHIRGSGGRDVINSIGGADLIEGFGGDDEITAWGAAVIRAGAGDDWVSDDSDGGSVARAFLGTGNDVAYAWSSGRVEGGPGNDTFRLETGQDDRAQFRFVGGRGTDRITWSNCGARVDTPAGTFRCGDDYRGTFVGIDRFSAAVCAGYYPSCGHQRYRDVFLGGPANNVFRGGPGQDLFHGRKGNDLLDGGRGTDRAYGGPGRDRCPHVERRSSC